MARIGKKPVERLPRITDPRRQLAFRFRSYTSLIADLGRVDALASSLTLSVRYFTDAAETRAKELEEKMKAEARAAGEVERDFSEDQKRRAMWDFGNAEADRFGVNTKNPAFEQLSTHTAQLLLVGVHQQAESFLTGVREELKTMGQSWPQRGNHVPLLEYTLQNLPGGLTDNKIKIGTERYELFEYYRLMRNSFVHTSTDRKKLATYFKNVRDHRKRVESEYNLSAPNPFECLSYDDYHLFTRLAKYIATDICRIGEPTDKQLVKLIEWKGAAVQMPLARFMSCRWSNPLLRTAISGWFNKHYGLKLENRPSALDELMKYIDEFPNKSLRKKSTRRAGGITDQ